MKKIILALFAALFLNQLQAQVGVNTTIPKGMLDVESTTNGMLIPRIALTAANVAAPVVNPQGGALVTSTFIYNTATAGVFPNNVVPGYYYWDNAATKWIPFGNGGTNWGLTGNSGTDPLFNFIGTTDATDLIFKRNGSRVGYLSSSNVAFGPGSSSGLGGINNIALGNASLFSNTGNNNIALGSSSLLSNTTGSTNIGIGLNTLAANTTGSNNIAIGNATASNLTLGSNNIIIGNNVNAISPFSTDQLNIGDIIYGNIGTTKNIGINSTFPKGVFDVASNTNGILIPRIALTASNVAAPVVNPQGGALVTSTLIYNTTTAGVAPNNVIPGFYYWDNTVVKWIPIISGTIGSTLDQSYDFGGAGVGRTITADTGAVIIAGTDGLVSTGTILSGAIAPSGAGTRMVWNPRMGAFRTGTVTGTQWDNANIGENSVAFGEDTQATDYLSAAFGLKTTASEVTATAFGVYSVASGMASTAFGHSNVAPSYAETVLGTGATLYTPSLNGSFLFGPANVTDRLLVVGNAIDTNGNNLVDTAERSDALVILKNGNTGIGSSTPQDKLHVVGNIRMVDGNQGTGKILVSDTNGKGTWTTAGTIASGTLDQAYDFGGAGVGKTITADTGAVTISGTDGLVSTGTIASGAIAPAGAGTRMVWNPRKAAFRAGRVAGTEWDDANIGNYSVAMGRNNTADSDYATAFGNGNTAGSTAATAIGNLNSALGNAATAIGDGNNANVFNSTAIGYQNTTAGNFSMAFGNRNTASSYGETTLGIGATFYTPSANGVTRFRIGNVTDRLLVVGNALDADNDNVVDDAERSDALVILKNGNTGIGSSTPLDKLHVVGNIRMVDGNQGTGKVLTSDTNGTGTWTTVGALASGTLDQAYDFGGAGVGRTITADTGAVTIAGTDGLISTGVFGSGATIPFISLSSMIWNPRKAAFRAGRADTGSWNDVSVGNYSAAFGYRTYASGTNATAFGDRTNANGDSATAFGYDCSAFGSGATAFGRTTEATGSNALSFGIFTHADGDYSTAFGNSSHALGNSSTAFGYATYATGNFSTAAGMQNNARSFCETVIGIGATEYTTTTDGDTKFATANATDRLFVVGNAIDVDNNGLLQPAEYSNALVILKNGRVGIGFDDSALIGGQFQLSLDQGRKPGTNTWTIASDERLKTIHGNYSKGLEEILKLQPITYNYTNTGKRTFEEAVLKTEFSGFSAQEVQKVFPEAVGTDDDGYLNFNMHPILVASVNAFKELNQKNEQLQSENEVLKNQLSEQNKTVEAILERLSKLEAKKE